MILILLRFFIRGVKSSTTEFCGGQFEPVLYYKYSCDMIFMALKLDSVILWHCEDKCHKDLTQNEYNQKIDDWNGPPQKVK